MNVRMDSTFAAIPTRSKQQALDWSLVLVSQGIESTIEPVPETDRWQLIVAGSQSQRAIQVLRQYRVENPSPAWRQHLDWNGLIFDWRNVAWFLLLALIFALDASHHLTLTKAGVMDSQAVWSGQWWRLFTAVTLHRDLPHLASNLTVGILLLGLAMGSFGSGMGLLAAYLAGVGGNVAGLFLYAGRHMSLGASGMVFGALGLLSGQTIGLLLGGLSSRGLAARGLMSGFLFLILFGFNPDSDVIAHLGGFCSGALFGGVLSLLANRLAENTLVNRLAELVCAGLVMLSWWAALRR